MVPTNGAEVECVISSLKAYIMRFLSSGFALAFVSFLLYIWPFLLRLAIPVTTREAGI